MCLFYNNLISGHNVCVRFWNSSVVLPLVTSLIRADCRTVRSQFQLPRIWRTLQVMYLITQKIHVAFSSLELSVYCNGWASHSYFCCYGDEKSGDFSYTCPLPVLCEWSVRLIGAVPYILTPYRITTLVKKHVNQISLYCSEIFSLTDGNYNKISICGRCSVQLVLHIALMRWM
jgi:hypothetical protein